VVVKWQIPPTRHLKITVTPPKVKIKGVKTLLDKVKAVATYPIALPREKFRKR